ncbi:MAG: GTP-binding protein [Promethearchaeota archaeon]|nr:MAG: GTP-binding protein [Candidatus Lokiarchaeota archaeon]
MHNTVKIVVSGDGGVGKTSFLNRLVHDHFDEDNELTRGVDFFSKIIQVNGTEYNFILWDFAGQNQFKEIIDKFVDGSIAAFILFDLSRLNTLETVLNWINKLKTFGNIPILLLGTKLDLVESERIKLIDDYINQITQRYENVFDYLKISSKTGYNINQSFLSLISKISQSKS